MAAGGVPLPDVLAAENTILSALEMQEFLQMRFAERTAKNLPALQMRAGINSGKVVAGIVGVKKFQYDIWGDTVNTASRMEATCEKGMVNISNVTYSHVYSNRNFKFINRGMVEVKGKGEMELFYVSRA